MINKFNDKRKFNQFLNERKEYVENLKESIKRLNIAKKYYEKMNSAQNERKENYFYEYIKMYLEKGEDLNNFLKIKEEYEEAYKKRKEKINSLYDEIKKIKKLKL